MSSFRINSNMKYGKRNKNEREKKHGNEFSRYSMNLAHGLMVFMFMIEHAFMAVIGSPKSQSRCNFKTDEKQLLS